MLEYLSRIGFGLIAAATLDALAAPPAPWAGTVPVSCAPSSNGITYNVGPGQALSALAEVDWNSLQPGDTVRLFWRDTPYREKILLRGIGTAPAPITFCGVANPATGALPVLDAADATTRADLDFAPTDGSGFNFEDYALVNVYRRPYESKPAHIHIKGLELRGAKGGVSYTSRNGEVRNYIDAASCLRIQEGDNIRIEGNRITDCGFGVFTLAQSVESQLIRALYVGGNAIYENGNPPSYFEHNLYLQAIDSVIEFNYIGTMRAGAPGASLKDRSGSTLIRYNTLDCNARCLDLVEPQEHWAMLNEAAYVSQQMQIGEPVDPVQLQRVREAENAFRNAPVQVYGNVIHNTGSNGSSAMIHYGADSIPAQTRVAPLYFFNNTVSILSDRTSQGGGGFYLVGIFDRGGNFNPTDPALPPVTISASNNIFQVAAETPGAIASYVNLTRTKHPASLTLVLNNNWLDAALQDPGAEGYPEPGTVEGLQTSIFGSGLAADPRSGAQNTPAFADLSVPPNLVGIDPVLFEYRGEDPAQKHVARPADGVLDLGAREASSSAVVFNNGFE